MYSFYDIAQAKMYLQGCIVMLKGTPVHITNVQETYIDPYGIRYKVVGESVDYKNMHEQFITHISSDGGLPFQPLQLGFLNTHNLQCQSLFRMPIRAWKAGITTENVVMISVFGDRNPISSKIMHSSDMENVLCNNYPSYEKARSNVSISDGNFYTEAFSRDFALSSNGKLLHRFEGIVGKAEENIDLLPEFNFLQQTLELAL